MVSHLRNDGTLVGVVPTPTGSASTGVSVDAAGKVWTANVTVVEGNTGLSPATPATFTVALDTASTVPVSVEYATDDGSAIAPDDYVAGSGPVTFAPGETSMQVTVNVVGDLADEADETFHVRPSTAKNAEIADGDGLGTILDDDRSGGFSGRATGVRVTAIELAVSNGPNVPCVDRSASVLNLPLGLGTIGLGARLINSSTNQTPDDLVNTTPALGDRSEADAEASSIVLVAGLSVVRASVVRVRAEARCGAPLGSAPKMTSSMTVANLTVNGHPVTVGGGETKINLRLGVLHINNTTTTSTSITKRGIWFENKVLPAGLDIVVGEAKADFSGNPCT